LRSRSSCVASCSASCLQASSASATSAFWLIDGAPLSCHFASSSWGDQPICHPHQNCSQGMRKARRSGCLLSPRGPVPSAAAR
jgi:hypothetical protein